MDDGYLICEDKKHLQVCMKKLYEITDNLHLELNDNKTHIFKMTSPMEYLKARVKVVKDTSAIVVKPNRKNITRNRRKLKKLKDGLKQHNESSQVKIDKLYNQYVDSRNEAVSSRSFLNTILSELPNYFILGNSI